MSSSSASSNSSFLNPNFFSLTQEEMQLPQNLSKKKLGDLTLKALFLDSTAQNPTALKVDQAFKTALLERFQAHYSEPTREIVFQLYFPNSAPPFSRKAFRVAVDTLIQKNNTETAHLLLREELFTSPEFLQDWDDTEFETALTSALSKEIGPEKDLEKNKTIILRLLDLIEKIPGAVDIPNGEGLTPLILAAKNPRKATTFDHLIEAKANPNYESQAGRSALTHAILSDNTHAIETLVQSTHYPQWNSEFTAADFNAKDSLGETPLTLAVKQKRIKIIELLLKAKADPKLRNSKGKSAIELAKTSGNQRILDLIEIHLPKTSQEEDGKASSSPKKPRKN